MSKVLSKEELEIELLKEKNKIYELENTELQIILKNYYNKTEEKLDISNFESIRDEYYYLINKLEYLENQNKKLDSELLKIKKNKWYRIYSRLRGKND